MKIHDLVEHFSSYTQIPVDPDELVDQLRHAGIRDEISFIEVDIDTRILRGALHTFVFRDSPYGEPQICSEVYYASGQSRAWKRLVCCKELLHLLDGSTSKTKTPDDFQRLLEGLCIEQDAAQIAENQLQIWGDKLMVYYAMAIVFPEKVRNYILEAEFPNAHARAMFAAEHLDIPVHAASAVLSPHWPGILNLLKGNK